MQEDFKTGISDMNMCMLEGTVVGRPRYVYDDDFEGGISAINFTISSERYTTKGMKQFYYDLVAFCGATRSSWERIQEGAFVRCNGHLMSYGEMCRPVVDYIQINE